MKSKKQALASLWSIAITAAVIISIFSLLFAALTGREKKVKEAAPAPTKEVTETQEIPEEEVTETPASEEEGTGEEGSAEQQ